MRKHVICILACFVISVSSAQEIFFSTINQKLYRLDIDNCSYEFITNLAQLAFDISFHPNGNLYGLSGVGKLYRINTTNGSTTDVSTFPEFGFNALTIDANGIAYAMTSQGEVYTYNFNTNSNQYLGKTSVGSTGDLTFYEGNLYAAVFGDQIMKIDISNPSNSEIVIQDDVYGEIWGIVTYAENCDDSKTYALTNGNTGIFLIDFENKSLDYVCDIPLTAAGGASTFEFFASEPIEIQGITKTDPTCNQSNGEFFITASGGSGNLQYSIDGVNYQNSDIFNQLPAGLYIVYIRDNNNCVKTETVELMIENSPEIQSVVAESPPCIGGTGSIEIFLTGGTPPIQFSLDNVNFQNSNIFENVPIGIHTLYVRDNLGCLDSENTILEVTNTMELEEANIIPVHCFGNGSIEMGVIGNSGPYTYALEDIGPQSDGNFTNLAVGSYQITATDNDGCEYLFDFEIEASISPTIDQISSTPSSCIVADGAITFETTIVDGGVVFLINGEVANDEDFQNLAAGTYTVAIRDIYGCGNDKDVTVHPQDIPIIEAVTSEPNTCQEANGSILAKASSSNGSVSYAINNSAFQINGEFLNLPAGNYRLIVKDEKDCTAEEDISIAQGTILSIGLDEIIDSQCGEENGSIYIIPSGGVGDILISFNEGLLGELTSFEELEAGTYPIYAVDEKECRIEDEIQVDQDHCPVFAPNVFSPNSDNINDEFKLFSNLNFNGVVSSLQIFDRWGNLIFIDENKLPNEISWDGYFKNKIVNPGVYVYTMEILYYDGVTENITGDVTVIR